MPKQEEEAEILEKELVRLGYPTGRRGDARDRGELLGSAPGVVKQWLTARYSPPAWVWIILKLYSMLSGDQRILFRQWAREEAERRSKEKDE